MRDRRKSYYVFGVLFILLAGLAVRLLHVRFGLPYKWADDAKIFYFANKMLYARDIIPDYFMYSSISMYIQSFVMLVIGLLSKLLVALGSDLPAVKAISSTFLAEPTMNFQLKTEFAYYSVLAGRGVFALFNILSGYFVYKILRRCTGSRLVSMLGLMLNVTLFIQFQYGVLLRQENLSLFFLAATAYYTIRLYEKPTPLRAALLGIVSAITVTVEYSLMPILIVPMAVYIISGLRKRGLWSPTETEIKYRIRQAVLLFLVALIIYCAFVLNVSLTSKEGLLYLLSIKYKVGGAIIAATMALLFLAYMINRFFIKKTRLFTRLSPAVLKANIIPYYFIYGLLPTLIIFNLGLFIKFYDYGRQVFVYLLGAYTKEFRFYTLTTPQMIRQAFSYIFNEQMGHIYTLLFLLSPLALFNKKIEKEMRKKIAIIFAFVSILLSIFIFRLHLFHTHRFIAVSALQVCLVVISAYSIFLYFSKKSRVFAYCLIIPVILAGAHHHVDKTVTLSMFTRPSETRTLAVSWVGREISDKDITVIDKALRMNSVDLKRNNVNARFLDVDETLFQRLDHEGISPRFIITTDRKITEEEFDRTNKESYERYKFSHLAYMPSFKELFKRSYFDLGFLSPRYSLRKSFIRERVTSAKGSMYGYVTKPRISVIDKGYTPYMLCNPDILIFEREDGR